MNIPQLDNNILDAFAAEQLAAIDADDKPAWQRSFDQMLAYLNSCGLLRKLKPEQSVEPF